MSAGHVKTLTLGPGLTLPLDTATQAQAFLGRRGSGKSYTAGKLAEEMLDADIQIIVLDPVGTWWGLRLLADGKGAGFPIPVFGGLHGDVPLEPGAGALIADLIADRGIPAVLDVSQMLVSEQARFAYDFATRFFQRKKAAPSVVHLFIEECQEFVPQNVTGKGGFEAKMLHAFERIIKLGRNFGIGVSLISQRPQEVNKKALNQSEVLYAFQMTGPQERKTIQGWVSDKGLSADLADMLPHLKVGEPHVWSPQWLQISKTVKVGRKRTFDASSTPKVGAAKAEARPLAPVDLERIREAMAATIERAEADDPKVLRRRIAELERELRTAKAAPAPSGDGARSRKDEKLLAQLRMLLESAMKFIVEINTRDFFATVGESVDQPALQRAIEAAVAQATKLLEATLTTRRSEFEQWRRQGANLLNQIERILGQEEIPVTVTVQRNQPFTVTPNRTRVSSPPAQASVGDSRPLRKGARRMLEALARRYPVPTTWPQCAQLAGLARTGGTFSTYQADLRKGGYVVEAGEQVELTDAGWEAIGQRPGTLSPQSTEEVLQLYSGVLRAGARRMLDELMSVYPGVLSRSQLGECSGIAESGGTFSTYLSDLRKAGLVDDDRGALRASELLMNPASAG